MKRGKISNIWSWTLLVSLVLAVAGCGGADSGGNNTGGSYSITGKISDSTGAGLAVVTVALSGTSSASVPTDSSGNYTFTGLANGTYAIAPSKSGSTFAPLSKAVSVNNANLSGQDFAGTVASGSTYTISGKVSDSSSAGMSGTTMTLSGANTGSTVTDSSGNYSFAGLGSGSYTVTPAKSGNTFNPSSRAVTVSSANSAGQDFAGSSTGGSGTDTTAPTVTSTNPISNATGFAVNTPITATFGETMTASTVTAATFTLNNGVTGTVTYSSTTATFTPSSNLSYNTIYTATISTGVKDAAGNAMASNYSWTFTTGIAPPDTTVTDIDGNIYNTVTIGTQVWMKENLKVAKYRNGDTIVTCGNCDISGEASPKYQWAYGGVDNRLYTWYAVTDSRAVCPTSWHVPTDSEWTTLTDYLGGASVAGGKMKEAGTTSWTSPNTGADNSSGFTALPGGFRSIEGEFVYFGYFGEWWSATADSGTGAWIRGLSYNNANAYPNGGAKKAAFSVRCIRD